MNTPQFHPLRIADLRHETADALSIAFDVPPALREAYRFTQGQHLTLRAEVDGEALRRSYSICAAVQDFDAGAPLRVAVKRVDGGRFSGHVFTRLRRGDTIDVMTPDGRFHVPLDAQRERHHVAFVAGSGITPVLSLVKTTLAAEPRSRFTVVYGNRDTTSIMFLEELEGLRNLHLGRLRLFHVLSRQTQEVDLFNGRIDAAKVRAFLDTLLPVSTIDEAFVCGPASMIDEVEGALLAAGVPREHVHAERFGVPGEHRSIPVAVDESAPAARMTVVLDGKSRDLRVPFDGASVLDVALAAGMDLPYACKGGVCCTCRARVLEGAVRMDRNFSLEPHEVERGFVLTCQSHPVSERLVVSYDER